MTATSADVSRVIRIFSRRTDELVGEIALSDFDLGAFQAVFCRGDRADQLFDCYLINHSHTAFIASYVHHVPDWNFDEYHYFLEADAIE